MVCYFLFLGDVLLVEDQSPPFSSGSAQILIQELMVMSCEMDIIREKQIKNMIHVLGRV